MNGISKITLSAVIGGTAESLGGGKFANGAVTGAYVMMLNHLGDHGGGGDDKLKQYVNKYFGKRLPTNVSIEWNTWSNDYGQTTSDDIANPNSDLVVYIPESYMEGDPDGLQYDCITHEIQHIRDYASGRAANWYDSYGKEMTEAIMDFLAFRQNQWYSDSYRNSNYNYNKNIKTAWNSLPIGWQNYYKHQ
ncbi:MAG: hypothetical protein HOO86_01850 [Bacteroidales bacterium]|nr:hypothetical protein [Bacteroidales bacterium]